MQHQSDVRLLPASEMTYILSGGGVKLYSLTLLAFESSAYIFSGTSLHQVVGIARCSIG